MQQCVQHHSRRRASQRARVTGIFLRRGKQRAYSCCVRFRRREVNERDNEIDENAVRLTSCHVQVHSQLRASFGRNCVR